MAVFSGCQWIQPFRGDFKVGVGVKFAFGLKPTINNIQYITAGLDRSQNAHYAFEKGPKTLQTLNTKTNCEIS